MIIALFKNNYKKIELNESGQKEPSLMINESGQKEPSLMIGRPS